MLRWVLLVLVAANAVFFSWSQGFWADQGWAPARVSEPERLQQEVQAQAIRLLNSAADTSAPLASLTPSENALPSEPTACWWASGLRPAEADQLRQVMGTLSLPPSSWSMVENRSSGRWIVYIGKFDSPELMAQRKAVLRRLKVDFREVTVPRLAPGLALGTYSSPEAAKEALSKSQAQGVRNARVVLERPEAVFWALRLPAITESQRLEVAGVGEALAGNTLQPCP
jgi:hypothetical protein